MSSKEVREFQVNEYITLKLENSETFIYIKGDRFIQCKYLLLNIQVDEITSLDKIDSIDEVAEELEIYTEPHADILKNIPPENEFWGHCSNLQIWYEHNYDTRLLHSSLSFPLLKKLTEVGDPLAKQVYLDEIYKRINNGYMPVINYLYIADYLDFLNREDFIGLILDSDANTLLELEKLLNINFELIDYKHSISIENKSIVQITLKDQGLKEIPISLANLLSLKSIDVSFNQIKTIPKIITNIEVLEYLDLNFNSLQELPESIGNLKNLKNLYLRGNKLTRIPDSIIKLEFLEEIDIRDNYFKEIPKVLLELKMLQKNSKLKININ